MREVRFPDTGFCIIWNVKSKKLALLFNKSNNLLNSPRYSHSEGSSTEDASLILLCVLSVSQTHFNQDRCHTKIGLKFYKLQMKKVSEKNANLLNNRSSVPNILGFKTFSKSEPRSQGFVPWDQEQCGSLLGRTPTFSFEGASYARGFRQSATESASRKPSMPHQCSRGSQTLYVEQRGSLEDLGLAPRSCGSQAAPCRIWWRRHLCQLWDCLYGAQMNVRLISQLSVSAQKRYIRNFKLVLRWSLNLENSKIPPIWKPSCRPSSATSVGLWLKASKTHQLENSFIL